MNNKIKVAKKSAYGYRDEDYFFILIRNQSSLGFTTISLKANFKTIKPLSQ
jgi:transposase